MRLQPSRLSLLNYHTSHHQLSICLRLLSPKHLSVSSKDNCTMATTRMTLHGMGPPYSVLCSFLLIVAGLGSPLQALSLRSSVLQLLPASNLTSSPVPNAASTDNAALEIHCSGEHFGHNPNIADCESAKEYLSPDSVQYAWGARHTGLGPSVFPLPYRIMGGQ